MCKKHTLTHEREPLVNRATSPLDVHTHTRVHTIYVDRATVALLIYVYAIGVSELYVLCVVLWCEVSCGVVLSRFGRGQGIVWWFSIYWNIMSALPAGGVEQATTIYIVNYNILCIYSYIYMCDECLRIILYAAIYLCGELLNIGLKHIASATQSANTPNTHSQTHIFTDGQACYRSGSALMRCRWSVPLSEIPSSLWVARVNCIYVYYDDDNDDSDDALSRELCMYTYICVKCTAKRLCM